jgi:hypothetical protein
MSVSVPKKVVKGHAKNQTLGLIPTHFFCPHTHKKEQRRKKAHVFKTDHSSKQNAPYTQTKTTKICKIMQRKQNNKRLHFSDDVDFRS